MARAAADIAIKLGDFAYQQGDWATAIAHYERALVVEPGHPDATSLALAIGLCWVELTPADRLDGLALPALGPRGGERERRMVSRVRYRALRFCRDGEPGRAGHLLRFLAGADPAIAAAYARRIDAPASGLAERPEAARGGATFPELYGLTDDRVAAWRARAPGKRLLIVMRRYFHGVAARRYESNDVTERAAIAFGFTVRHLNSHTPPAGGDATAFAAALEAAIAEFRPDIVFFDELFATGLTGEGGAAAERVAEALRAARRAGAQVVNWFFDAWCWTPEQVYRGLGDCVDIVMHCHPGLLDRSTPAQNDATVCCMHPCALPEPTVPRDTIARACFAGSIYDQSIPRLVWWAESARRGLALDVLESDHTDPGARSDQDFANLFRAYRLSVNFTSRESDIAIATGRTIQIPLSGGVLLEEHSSDAAFLLRPGTDYLPFATLDDLAALLERLLGDPARCAAIADAGRAHVTRLYTGDYFWAGMLDRLAR